MIEKVLICRELLYNDTCSRRLGFFGSRVRSLSKSPSKLEHDGCVNAVRWHQSGNILLSGSDDRTVKLWDTARDLNQVKLLKTVCTEHQSNIFCVDFCATSDNIVLSCAADGTLRSSDMNSRTGRSLLVSSDNMMHMFLCHKDNPNVLFTAEEAGCVSRYDMRENRRDVIFTNFQSGLTDPCSVKTLTQPTNGPGNSLVIGGGDLVVGEVDLRMVSASQPRLRSFHRTWNPSVHKSAHFRFDSTAGSRSLSASCVSISKDDKRLLVNYQGDHIYIFDYSEGEGDSLECDWDQRPSSVPIAPVSCLGGHFNYDTFLKTAYFFGPRDEYVVAGSDSGALWIWDSSSGKLSEDNDGFAEPVKVVNVLIADGRTCNGVVPHPFLPVLASYGNPNGIDSDAKLWMWQSPSEDDLSSSSSSVSVSHTLRGNLCSVLEEQLLKLASETSVSDVAARRILTTADEDDVFSVRGRRRYRALVSDSVRFRDIIAGIRRQEQLLRTEKIGKLLPGRLSIGQLTYFPDFPTDIGFVGEKNGFIAEIEEEEWRSYLPVPPDTNSALPVSPCVSEVICIVLQLLKICSAAKQEGNDAFKAGLWDEAAVSYHKGLRYVLTIRKVFTMIFSDRWDSWLREYLRNPSTGPVPRVWRGNPAWPEEAYRLVVEHFRALGIPSELESSDADSFSEVCTKDGFSRAYAGNLRSMESQLLHGLRNIWWGIKESGRAGNDCKCVISLLERTLLTNEAAALMQMEEYSDAKALCDRALSVKSHPPEDQEAAQPLPPDPKTLYRRGCILLCIQEPDEAIADFSRALELEPGDAAVGKKLKEARRLMEDNKKREKKKYKKMFS